VESVLLLVIFLVILTTMSLDYYNAKEKHWVSPRLILVYYEDLLKIYGDNFYKDEFKKVLEAKTVAIALLGVHKGSGIQFFMQIPKSINSSPDIITMNLKEYPDKPVQMETQDIEVVEYGENSDEDLATFLIKEKLSPVQSKKAYDEKTIIMCRITKNIVGVDNQALHNEIKKINPKPIVYLTGPIFGRKGFYRLVRVWPILDSYVEIDVRKEAINYPYPDSCLFGLGMGKKINFGKTKLPLPTPYEVFELNEEKLRNKFNPIL